MDGIEPEDLPTWIEQAPEPALILLFGTPPFMTTVLIQREVVCFTAFLPSMYGEFVCEVHYHQSLN